MAHSHDGAHGAHGHAEGVYGHISVGTYWRVFIGLMVLMGLTVGAYYIEKIIDLPAWMAVLIAMTIASAKTALIIIYFMHVKVSSRITQIFAASAFIWLLILFGITMGDYFSRGWPPQEGPLTSVPSGPPAWL